MGFIKEPKGVDFTIKSKPLTGKDRREISKFIADYKARNEKKRIVKAKPKHPANRSDRKALH